MGPRALARAVAVGGMAAVSAVLAHGGAAGLRNDAWITAAAVGSVLVGVALTIAGEHAAMLRRRLDRIAAGDARVCLVDSDPAATLSALVAAALACQAGAHAGLLVLGVHPSSAVAAPTLHVLLAFVTAPAVYGLDRVLDHLGAAVADAVRVLRELLFDALTARSPAPRATPPSRMPPQDLRSRAPPIAA